jgi:hypothetical protein
MDTDKHGFNAEYESHFVSVNLRVSAFRFYPCEFVLIRG